MEWKYILARHGGKHREDIQAFDGRHIEDQ